MQVIRQFENRLLPGVHIGVLRRIDPVRGSPDIVGGLFSNRPDFFNYARRKAVGSVAATWDPNSSRVLISRFGTAGVSSFRQFAHGLKGEILHEFGHMWSSLRLSGTERRDIINQADHLNVLGLPFSHYAALKLGLPVSGSRTATLRDAYEEAYQNHTKAQRARAIDEEKIATLTELYHYGIVRPEELAPQVREILDKIVGGDFAAKPAPITSARKPGPPPGSAAALRAEKAAKAPPGLLTEFERQNESLSNAEYRDLAARDPSLIANYRAPKIFGANNEYWYSPVSLLQTKLYHERVVEKRDYGTYAPDRWSNDLRLINEAWDSLPFESRIAAEHELFGHWGEYFNPLFSLSGMPGEPKKLQALAETAERLKTVLCLRRSEEAHPDMRLAGDVDTIAEKGGERLREMIGKPLESEIAAHEKELDSAGGFGSFFKDYLLEPERARERAPNFYEAFENLLDTHDPGLLEDLEHAQTLIGSGDFRAYRNSATMQAAAHDQDFHSIFGMGRRELFKRLGAAAHEYTQAQSVYDNIKATPSADNYLRSLPENLRTYALFNSNRDVAKLHPLTRASELTKLVYKMQKEILQSKLRDTAPNALRSDIYMGPVKAQQVNDALTLLSGAELRNAFSLLKEPGFEASPEIDPNIALGSLSDLEPEVRQELERRIAKAKLPPWQTVKQFFPNVARDLNRQFEDAYEAKKISGGAANGPPPQGPGAPPSPPAGGPGGGKPPPRFAVPKNPDTFAGKLKNAWINTFQPEMRSDLALMADPRFAEFAASTAQQTDALVRRMDDDYGRWQRVLEKQRLQFFLNMETGQRGAMSPWEREQADYLGRLLKKAYDDEVAMGSKAEFRENYLPHAFEDAAGFSNLIESLQSAHNLGPTWFQKARYFDLIQQGLDHGYKLKTTNPVDLVTLRLIAGIHMRERMALLNDMRDLYGLAIKAKDAPGDYVRNGWRAINAPDQERWLISPDIQPLWNNAVDAKGLWASQDWYGGVFRGWMAFKNVFVPIKLAFSGFHPLHVMHINFSNHMNRAKIEIQAGNFGKAGKNLLRAADVFAIWTGSEGRAARRAWLVPEEEQTPQERHYNTLLKEAGFSPQLSEQLRIAARRGLAKAYAETKMALAEGSVSGSFGGATKLFGTGLKRFIEISPFNLIFEHWIPDLKASALLFRIAQFAEQHPDIMDDPIQRRVALRTIGKRVDNRFGQMFYGSLLWNKTLKDSLMASFISLGWQTGLVRDAGGGALSPAVRLAEKLAGKEPTETRKTIRLADDSSSYWLIYFGSFALLNAMITWINDGAPDSYLDFLMAKIGGKNPDGTPRRITNMSYLREIPMAIKHIEEEGGGIRGTIAGLKNMALNKTLLEPFAEIAKNRDYFGYDLYDPYSDWWLAQLARSELKNQLSPITVSGAREAAALSGKPLPSASEFITDPEKSAGDLWTSLGAKGVGLSMLGFGPAPAYVSRNATQNRIAYLFRQRQPYSKPYEQADIDHAKYEARQAYKAAVANGNDEAIRAAQEQLSAANAKAPTGIPGDIYMFKQLQAPDQKAILQSASPEDIAKYYRYAKAPLWADPEFVKKFSNAWTSTALH